MLILGTQDSGCIEIEKLHPNPQSIIFESSHPLTPLKVNMTLGAESNNDGGYSYIVGGVEPVI